jgi:DNA primase
LQTLATEQRRFLEEATMKYMEFLPDALEYLAKRGIPEEAARRNGLGVVGDPLKEHRHLKGRLAIPYLTSSGPVNMSFRCLEDHDCKAMENHGKYIQSAGLEARLYGVQSYEDAGAYLAVCEGELDTLVLNMAGVPAVGVSGATKWQKHWTHILQDFSRVFIFSDGDSAGQEFAQRVMIEYEYAINVPMPQGMDVNDVYLKYGADFLLNKIKD